MKREKQYQMKSINKIKFKFVIMMFILLLLITFIILFLNYHLYVIQNIERLEKIKDYSDFKINIEKNELACGKDKLIYETEDYRFFLTCLKEVYVYYGSTRSSLTYALNKKYITPKLIKENLYKQKENGYIKYTHQGTKNPKEMYALYEFTRENDKTDYYITAY